MSTFNADSFLNTTVDQVNQTQVIPHPEGDFEFQIEPLTKDSIKTGTSKQSGKTWVQLTVKLKNLDPNVAKELEMEDIFMYDTFFIDLDDQGAIDFGPNRNVNLGKYREAAGMNVEGEEFAITNLGGATIGATVQHKLNNDGEPRAFVKTVVSAEG